MNKTEKTLMRAGLLIGLAMLGRVSTAHAGNVQDQADCAQMAGKDYDAVKAGPHGKGLSKYESHYNTKMHACLVLQHYYYAPTSSEPMSTGVALFDQVGGHIYANYMDRQEQHGTNITA